MAQPNVVVACHMKSTLVERKAIREGGFVSRANKVLLLEEPMAAAIGAGMPVHGNQWIFDGG